MPITQLEDVEDTGICVDVRVVGVGEEPWIGIEVKQK
jgi:hypothetical protein